MEEQAQAPETKINVLHSQASDVWYTPIDIVERARNVLQVIDLDPASDVVGNGRVKARRFIGEEENGLTAEWLQDPNETGTPNVSVFLNPPGKKFKGKSLATHFWARLVREWELGHVTHAIFVAYSLEQLQTSQQTDGLSIGAFPMCIPRSRLTFEPATRKEPYDPGPRGENEDEVSYKKRVKAAKGTQDSPTHGNAIVYIPKRAGGIDEFVEHFSPVGDILLPRLHGGWCRGTP